MEQKFNDELMPTVGVYCTMACADYQPPRLLSASESEAVLRTVDEYDFGVIYPAVLDELDPLDDGEVVTVNEPFDMSKVICST